jgi:hypothetical protein
MAKIYRLGVLFLVQRALAQGGYPDQAITSSAAVCRDRHLLLFSKRADKTFTAHYFH